VRLEVQKARNRWRIEAFSLLEVMIAVFIFFMAVFSILELVSQNLRAARLLQSDSPNAGVLAAELSLTNKLEEGTDSGDFGDLYPAYSWSRDIFETSSNGLFQVDFVVFRQSQVDSTMSVLLFKPESGAKTGPRGFSR
jgi:Tfp pilus assembly protein PilV